MKVLALMITLMMSVSVWAARVEVDINGMTCGMCVEAITGELNKTDKAEEVKVSLEEKKARFVIKKDKTFSDAEIKEAVKKAGYQVAKIVRKK
ncbi:MAG: heavy-metal-associated domain-containing protein [Bacteriovoracaceae bacterium]|jgi:copper chaperone